MKEIGIYRIVECAETPERATEFSACYDLRACLHKDIVKINGSRTAKVYKHRRTGKRCFDIMPMERALVPTGLIFLLPQSDKMSIKPRSGLAYKSGIMVANSPGTIDEDYTNETFVLLINVSDNIFTISDGDRVAQAEIEPANISEYEFKDISLSDVEHARQGFDRKGGIGHTGVK